METLIVNNSSKKDIALLLDFAKKIGLDVKLATSTELKKTTTVLAKPKLNKQKEIMKISKEINKSMHKKLLKQYNLHNDSNY